jgi:hypothetical protein
MWKSESDKRLRAFWPENEKAEKKKNKNGQDILFKEVKKGKFLRILVQILFLLKQDPGRSLKP